MTGYELHSHNTPHQNIIARCFACFFLFCLVCCFKHVFKCYAYPKHTPHATRHIEVSDYVVAIHDVSLSPIKNPSKAMYGLMYM